MHRRDVLKVLPLSIAGITELVGMGPRGSGDTAEIKSSRLVAQVRSHNGTPTLFLNGEPVFAGMCWVSTPSTEGWRDSEHARAVAKAGIHIYSFDAGKDFEWVEPKAGRSDPFDFSTVEARYGRIIDVDPLARFHLRLHFEFQPGDWWMKAYPGECEIASDGKAGRPVLRLGSMAEASERIPPGLRCPPQPHRPHRSDHRLSAGRRTHGRMGEGRDLHVLALR